MKKTTIKSYLLSLSALAFSLFTFISYSQAEDSYVEPGSLRLTHNLILEGVAHKLQPGWGVVKNGLNGRNKDFPNDASGDRSWDTEWGQRLVTEVATRVTPDIFGRVLFEAQGEYADRFWRPVNAEHDAKIAGHPLILKQSEIKINKDEWYLHAFNGVGHGTWKDKGDFFELYPESIGESSYLGSSSFFGFFPTSWNQDTFLNISQRHAPRGAEGGFYLYGLDASVAYGDEIVWGYKKNAYARASYPFGFTKATVVVKDEDVPYSFDDKERKRAYSLSWDFPFDYGFRVVAGALYEPFRVGKVYQSASDVSAGAGLFDSDQSISEKKSGKSDAIAEKVHLEGNKEAFDRVWNASLDAENAGILAGNRQQIGAGIGTDITSTIKWQTDYKYRRPIEGPIPFLYEGTPDNIGAVASNPRSPADSPFVVDWTNREAVFLVTTFWFDPSPGSLMFLYDPTVLAGYNLNPDESSPLTLAFQHRMSDYLTSTDRQTYYNIDGDLVVEPAAHTGAWGTRHPLHEFRLIGHGKKKGIGYSVGVAGGQTLAQSGLAYVNSTAHNKAITEYYSLEGQLDVWPWAVWGNYGTGVWGPEPNIHPYFGSSYDRLWSLGVRYNITKNTTWDVNYISAHQTDNMFVMSDIGSFDEIRTLFTHKFGFIFQFQKPARPGYEAR